jgi:hypothetical protein
MSQRFEHGDRVEAKILGKWKTGTIFHKVGMGHMIQVDDEYIGSFHSIDSREVWELRRLDE